MLLPQLREEYEQVMRELEAEQACVAEIESCDQKYLSELKAEIAVQELVYLPDCFWALADFVLVRSLRHSKGRWMMEMQS